MSQSVIDPPRRHGVIDVRLRRTLWGVAGLASSIIAVVVAVVATEALPALRDVELLRFLNDPSWHPTNQRYNLAPMIAGAFLVAGGAVAFGTLFGFLSAIFCCFYAPPRLAGLYRGVTELFAGIPSVILGLWGLTTLVPIIAAIRAPGFSVLSATLVLGLMIVPTIGLVAIASLQSVHAP